MHVHINFMLVWEISSILAFSCFVNGCLLLGISILSFLNCSMVDCICLSAGMFTYEKKSRVFWFSSAPCDNYQEFNLVGVVSFDDGFNSVNLRVAENQKIDSFLPRPS